MVGVWQLSRRQVGGRWLEGIRWDLFVYLGSVIDVALFEAVSPRYKMDDRWWWSLYIRRRHGGSMYAITTAYVVCVVGDAAEQQNHEPGAALDT